MVGAGYFFVWVLWGVAAFALGIALAGMEMGQPALARAVPIAVGAVILLAGAFQFSAWKARHLACCLGGSARHLLAGRACHRATCLAGST